MPDTTMIIMIVFVGLMVVMMIPTFLSGRKKKKAAAEKMSKLSRGDKVMLMNGFLGVVDAIDQPNHTVTVNISSNSTPVPVTLDLNGIYKIIDEAEEKARAEMAKKREEEIAAKKDEPVATSADDLAAEEKRLARQKAKEEKKTVKAQTLEYKLPENFSADAEASETPIESIENNVEE